MKGFWPEEGMALSATEGAEQVDADLRREGVCLEQERRYQLLEVQEQVDADSWQEGVCLELERNGEIDGLVRKKTTLIHGRNRLLVNDSADQRVTKCI